MPTTVGWRSISFTALIIIDITSGDFADRLNLGATIRRSDLGVG
jgi:hypothetical protein